AVRLGGTPRSLIGIFHRRGVGRVRGMQTFEYFVSQLSSFFDKQPLKSPNMLDVGKSLSKFIFALLIAMAVLLARGACATKATGTLVLGPSDIHFGNVVSGTSKDLSCTLTNAGAGSVTISRAVPSVSTFSVTQLSLPLILGPGASVKFTVR